MVGQGKQGKYIALNCHNIFVQSQYFWALSLHIIMPYTHEIYVLCLVHLYNEGKFGISNYGQLH